MPGVSSIGSVLIPIMIVRTGDKTAINSLAREIKSLPPIMAQANSSAKRLDGSVQKVSTSSSQGAWGWKHYRTEVSYAIDAETGLQVTHTKTIMLNKSLTDRLNTLRWSMVNVSFAIMGLAALAYPFTQLAKFGMEMETLFTRVEIVTGNASKGIGESIRKLRDDTQYSIEEMGGAFLEFTKQGFSAEQAMKTLPAITNLSIVGFVELEKAVDMVSQVLHAFNLEAENAAHVSDVLANAANMSRASVEDFGVALSYASPVAEQAGISFEETATALAILTNKGLTASKAGTSLAAMMTQMLKPSDKTKETMGKLGLSFFNAEGKMKSLSQLTFEWANVLDDSEESLAFLYDSMGRRGGRAMANFLNEIRDTGETIEEFQNRIESATTAEENAGKMAETSAYKLKQSWGNLKDELVPQAESMNIWLNKIVSSLLSVASSVNELNDTDLTFFERLKKYYKYTDGNIIGKSMTAAKAGALDIFSNMAEHGFHSSLFKERYSLAKMLFGDRPVSEVTKEVVDEISDSLNDSLDKIKFPNIFNIADNMSKAQLEVSKAGLLGLSNSLTKVGEDITEAFKPSGLKTIESYLDEFEDIRTRFVSTGTMEDISILNTIISKLKDQRDDYVELSSAVKGLEVTKKELATQTKELTKTLSDEKKELSSLNTELAESKSKMSDITSSRFSGESQTLAIIRQAEGWRKKQELATLGVADAQQYISDALKLESSDYDDLFSKISKINSEMETNTDAFDAWQQSIKTAIRAEVSAGQELGKDVSSRVKTWQTALLGVSSSDTSGGSDTTQLDDFVNKLQLSYDVHFGGMKDNVTTFLEAQEDRELGVFSTSSQLIDSLKGEIVTRDALKVSIEAQESAVALASGKLETNVLDMAEVVKSITDKKEDIEGTITAVEDLGTSITTLKGIIDTAASIAQGKLDKIEDDKIDKPDDSIISGTEQKLFGYKDIVLLNKHDDYEEAYGPQTEGRKMAADNLEIYGKNVGIKKDQIKIDFAPSLKDFTSQVPVEDLGIVSNQASDNGDYGKVNYPVQEINKLQQNLEDFGVIGSYLADIVRDNSGSEMNTNNIQYNTPKLYDKNDNTGDTIIQVTVQPASSDDPLVFGENIGQGIFNESRTVSNGLKT